MLARYMDYVVRNYKAGFLKPKRLSWFLFSRYLAKQKLKRHRGKIIFCLLYYLRFITAAGSWL